jgi:hypothetical protein
MCIAARANVRCPRPQPTTLEASRSGKNRFARLLLTWFEVTRDLHDMDIRKPISVDVME